MVQILGQKFPFGGLCNCVHQKWGNANLQPNIYNLLLKGLKIKTKEKKNAFSASVWSN